GIAEWFRDDENRKLVEQLRGLGLRFEAGKEERPVDGPLTGSTYVVTGTLEGFTREEATAALEARGAKVSDSVSGKTTGLVVGERARPARDGQRGDHVGSQLGIAPHQEQERDERRRGRAVETREPRAVGEADAGERNARLRELRAHDAKAGCRRSLARLHRAE